MHQFLLKYVNLDIFDSRLLNNNYNDIRHFLISTTDKNKLGCHYSLSDDLGVRRFINCHGKITNILKETINS